MSAFVSFKQRRFGRWNLWVILAIHAVCVYGMIVGDHWAAFVFPSFVILVLWIGGYFNWKALLKIDRSRKDGHHVELFDAAKYTCVHGVKPDKRTMECAYPVGHDTEYWRTPPTKDERKIQLPI